MELLFPVNYFNTIFAGWMPDKYPTVVNYHSVGVKGGFENIPTSEFRTQIKWLDSKYDIVPLPKILNNPSDGTKRVAITFDDGLTSFYDNARPILSEYSAPATVFVLGAAVEDHESVSTEEILDDRLQTPETLMLYEELVELRENPLFTIGAHSITHPELPELDSCREIKREVIGSKELLESRLDISVTQFAYPYHQWDEGARKLVSEEFQYGVHGNGETTLITQNTDPYVIPRIDVSWELPFLQLYVMDSGKKLAQLQNSISRTAQNISRPLPEIGKHIRQVVGKFR